MAKRMREQMELRVEWLLSKQMNYSAKDFVEDFKKYQNAISEMLYLGLLSENVYEQCKDVLLRYIKYCK